MSYQKAFLFHLLFGRCDAQICLSDVKLLVKNKLKWLIYQSKLFLNLDKACKNEFKLLANRSKRESTKTLEHQ